MRLIEAMRITVFPGAPTIYTSILDHQERGRRDLSSLRLAVTGAAVVPLAPVERKRAPLSVHARLTPYRLTQALVLAHCPPSAGPPTPAPPPRPAPPGLHV